jgi:hypothetical protein
MKTNSRTAESRAGRKRRTSPAKASPISNAQIPALRLKDTTWLVDTHHLQIEGQDAQWLVCWVDLPTGLIVGWALREEMHIASPIWESFLQAAVVHGLPSRVILDERRKTTNCQIGAFHVRVDTDTFSGRRKSLERFFLNCDEFCAKLQEASLSFYGNDIHAAVAFSIAAHNAELRP